MPQMMPMKWLLILIVMLMFIIMTIINLYFNNLYKLNYNNNIIKNKKLWKWVW